MNLSREYSTLARGSGRHVPNHVQAVKVVMCEVYHVPILTRCQRLYGGLLEKRRRQQDLEQT